MNACIMQLYQRLIRLLQNHFWKANKDHEMLCNVRIIGTCNPKRYQHDPTTWPDNINVRRFMTKFAHAVSNIKPLGDWPDRKGRNLYNLGRYWIRIAVRKKFLALFATDASKYFGRTNNIMIWNEINKTAH